MTAASVYLSVLLPVYNEAENLERVIVELETSLAGAVPSFEIVVVDDGSTDGSDLLLDRLAASKPYLRPIFFRKNAGQTSAFDAGFRSARGSVVVTMDSDLQNDPRDIVQMVRLIDQGYDFVAGWRRQRQDGFLVRTLPSKIANALIRRVTRTKLHDLGCSLKAYRHDVAQELRLYGEMHRFIGVLMEGLGARVAEIEVNHRPRVAGVSKYGLMRTFKVLLDLLTVWFLQGFRAKPSYVFGGVGSALVLLSAVTASFVMWQKLFQAVWVHRNPLFVVAVFFAIVGIQFVALGLLAELQIRTYFESTGQRPYYVSSRPVRRTELPAVRPAEPPLAPAPCAE